MTMSVNQAPGFHIDGSILYLTFHNNLPAVICLLS